MKSNKLILILPLLLFLIYFGAGIFYDAKYVIYIKPFILPSFMMYAVIARADKMIIQFYFFVLFLYIGDMAILFGSTFMLPEQIALISKFLCYIMLIFLGKEVLSTTTIRTIFNGFTLIIFLLNCVLFFAIVLILMDLIDSVITDIIIVFNAISAAVLGIIAALYLSRDNAFKAFLYFFGSYALILSDVFGALESYYFENLVLNTADRLLHFVAFYLIYMYCIQDNSVTKNYTSDRIFI